MRMRTVSLIFFALISLTFARGHYAYADEHGQAESGKKAVKEVDAEEARVIIEDKKGTSGLVILDVRTDGEFSAGHIEGAVNMDVQSVTFKDEVGKLDKSKTYIVHCRTGKRSETAVKVMKEMGFADIYWMQDGIVGWQDAGYPVTK